MRWRRSTVATEKRRHAPAAKLRLFTSSSNKRMLITSCTPCTPPRFKSGPVVTMATLRASKVDAAGVAWYTGCCCSRSKHLVGPGSGPGDAQGRWGPLERVWRRVTAHCLESRTRGPAGPGLSVRETVAAAPWMQTSAHFRRSVQNGASESDRACRSTSRWRLSLSSVCSRPTTDYNSRLLACWMVRQLGRAVAQQMCAAPT